MTKVFRGQPGDRMTAFFARLSGVAAALLIVALPAAANVPAAAVPPVKSAGPAASAKPPAAAAPKPAGAAPAPAASASGAGRAAAAASTPPLAPPTTTDPAQWCARLAPALPGVEVSGCRASALVPGAGRSVNGVPLWSHDVLPAGGPPKFKVLLLGGIHGDELASVTLVFDWIARSQAVQAAAGPRVKTAKPTIADVGWRFVPLLNPDGLLHAPSTRVNAHGVDLNRNFPTSDWASDAQPYWIKHTRKDPRRFPGPTALSEPESRWLLDQIDQFHPDLIVSVHAPYGLLDFDGPPPAPRRLGSLQLDPVGIYPGSLGNYGGLVKNVPVMTLELKNSRSIAPRELAAMWTDLERWINEQLANPGMQANAQRVPAPGPKARGSARHADE